MLSTSKANRQYFRHAYRAGQHGWAATDPSPYAVTFLKRLARIVPGGRLLDIGCGEGRHAIAAAKLGLKVTAADYEPLALKRARRFARMTGIRGIAFREANVLDLPFSQARFDIVLDYGCLHHQRKSDWPAYMANILRVLKPTGFYVLSVFSPGFRLFCGSRRSWHIAYGAYRRYFTRGDIQHLFGGDFEILELIAEKGDDGGFWHALMRRRPAKRSHGRV
jgi:ubiquinone/menaquinone biosynthesis C-methylase UbiE